MLPLTPSSCNGPSAVSSRSSAPGLTLTTRPCSTPPPFGSFSQKQPPGCAAIDMFLASPLNVWSLLHHEPTSTSARKTRSPGAATCTVVFTVNPPADRSITSATARPGDARPATASARRAALHRERTEVLLISLLELVERIRVTRAAEVLQRVGGGDAPELRAHAEGRPLGEPLHEAAAERVADAGRVDDAMRRHGLDVGARPAMVQRAPLFAARDHQQLRRLENTVFAQAGLLPNELEFIVVADDHLGADDAIAQLVAAHPRALLAGIEDVGDLQRAALLRVLRHRGRIVRRDDDQADAFDRPERQLGGMRHGSGIERRDLIVLGIG